jgi:nitrite reductase/ring-hydroxylating ferredoxin subunit
MEGALRRVDVEGAQVMLVRQGGKIHAMSDVCSHLGCSLAEGHLEGDSVRCDCHGSRYSLEDGKVLDGPSAYCQPVYKTRIYGGQIQVGSLK